jgi:hypothetical protein
MPDFGFVGASYVAPSIYQDDQECINYYPEIDPMKPPGSRGVVALYPTPGLVEKYQLNATEVRGMRSLSGGQYMLVVCGNKVWQITVAGGAVQIGTLTTSTGPVDITDNQITTQGLAAYIVDGVNRYYWYATSNTFATLPSSDGPWQGADSCDTVDNYIVYNQPGTQNWAATDLDSVFSTSAYYGSKDGAPDDLVTLIVDRRQVFLLGEVTSEVWVDVGSQIAGLTTFPFQRIAGTSTQYGCAAKNTVARFGENFMFVSRSTLGQNVIGSIQGYSFVRVSTHAVEQSIIDVDVSDAVAYSYKLEGHEFYVVTFPKADLTWVYDNTTQVWHKWLSWDANAAKYYRHRSNCGCWFNNYFYVGDFENGKIYTLNNDVYTDNGNPIRRLRRAPHLTTDLQRQFFEELQIQFQPGVGLQTGQGDNPQAMLRWSNDGGSTWSNEHWVSIGKTGQYQNRAMWRRLGWSRDRIFEVVVSDPINAVIVSANLKASAGDN